MLANLEKFWKSLNQEVVVNKREVFLGAAACTLAGILTGILLSPKKSVTIGSHNGNNNTGNAASLPGCGDEDADSDAADEDGE